MSIKKELNELQVQNDNLLTTCGNSRKHVNELKHELVLNETLLKKVMESVDEKNKYIEELEDKLCRTENAHNNITTWYDAVKIENEKLYQEAKELRLYTNALNVENDDLIRKYNKEYALVDTLLVVMVVVCGLWLISSLIGLM